MRGRVHVIDLSRADDFRRAHIAGARFAIRARLGASLARLPPGHVVLTADDIRLLRLAAAEAAISGRGVQVLEGGNDAWRREKLPMEPGRGDPLDALEDGAYPHPLELDEDRDRAMERYLNWERGLLDQLERDGDARFSIIDFSTD
jgi:rhodanese-related sulfurtransferase